MSFSIRSFCSEAVKAEIFFRKGRMSVANNNKRADEEHYTGFQSKFDNISHKEER